MKHKKLEILVLEDSEARIRWFREKYDKDSLFVFGSVKSAIKHLSENKPDIIFLDHDLDGRVFVNSDEPNTGYQLAKHIADSGEKYESIYIHSMNPIGAIKMKKVLKEADSSRSIVTIPFPALVKYHK